MKKQINEFKRMQLLAGLITESEYNKSLNETEAPSDIKNFLLGMMDSFSEGNDNEYPAGKHMEFKYEEEYGDEDLYGEKTAKLFNKAKSFLSKSGPVTIQDTFAGQPLDLTFSVDGGDIKMEWIEPATNESPLNEAENNEVNIVPFLKAHKQELLNKVAKIEEWDEEDLEAIEDDDLVGGISADENEDSKVASFQQIGLQFAFDPEDLKPDEYTTEFELNIAGKRVYGISYSM